MAGRSAVPGTFLEGRRYQDGRENACGAVRLRGNRCEIGGVRDRVAVLVMLMRGSIVGSGAPDTREEIHDPLGWPVLWNSEVG